MGSFVWLSVFMFLSTSVASCLYLFIICPGRRPTEPWYKAVTCRLGWSGGQMCRCYFSHLLNEGCILWIVGLAADAVGVGLMVLGLWCIYTTYSKTVHQPNRPKHDTWLSVALGHSKPILSRLHNKSIDAYLHTRLLVCMINYYANLKRSRAVCHYFDAATSSPPLPSMWVIQFPNGWCIWSVLPGVQWLADWLTLTRLRAQVRWQRVNYSKYDMVSHIKRHQKNWPSAINAKVRPDFMLQWLRSIARRVAKEMLYLDVTSICFFYLGL